MPAETPDPARPDANALNASAATTAHANPAPEGVQAGDAHAMTYTHAVDANPAVPASVAATSGAATADMPAAVPAAMKAIRIHTYGGADTLQFEDAPVPTPGDNEVLIRVQAAGVNPADWKIRDGALKDMFPLTFPATLGTDVAGVVVAVGKSVSSLKPGMHVYGTADMARGGSYAQYAIAQAGAVAHKPGVLSAVEAASVPTVAMTAWQALHEIGRVQAYHKVLIHGAGGMVGLFAIQFAARAGAHVVALSRHENTHLIREMGASTVLDYDDVAFEQHVSGIDIALDTIGGEIRERTWRTLKPGGILITTSDPPSQDTAKEYGVRAAMVQMKPSGFLLSDFADWLNTGELRTYVDKVYPLEQAAVAQEAQREHHARGKVVLTVSQ